MTPRKPKQRQQHHRPTSTGFIQASDYESDAQTYTQIHVPPPTRTNTELNLSVLRRYNPSIRTILSIAANAVIYVFTPASQQWEKSGVEGTLFVCEQESHDNVADTSYCVIILNRRGLDNLILDLEQVQDVEITSELLIIRFEDGSAVDDTQRVMGIWIHKDKDDTRELNAGLIQQCWEKGKVSSQGGIGVTAPDGTLATGSNEDAAVGRRISLTDLFKQQSSQ